MGAALLTKLVNRIRKLDFLRDLPVFAWSDSQIVLCWLRKHPCNWKTFVANRVSYAQTELPSAEWKYVASKENPADLATCGMKPLDLKVSELWWDGPKWLSTPKESWPNQPAATRNFQILEREPNFNLLLRFSALTRLIRVTAYCIRFWNNLALCKIKRAPYKVFLTSSELDAARCVLIRSVQAETYSSEIKLLSQAETKFGGLSKHHPLRKLNPFVDERDGILRVGGRLAHSSLSHEAKHPPILPKQSHLSRLFAKFAHLSSLHGGPTLTQSILQQRVLIIGVKGLVKAMVLANEQTSWNFIPPNAPHCGGIWEAGVKSTKHHLSRVLGDRTLTFEELSTLLVQIEVCLNSRPLYPLSGDPDDLEVLTPSHFLMGTASGRIPDSELPNVFENRLNRHQLLQRIRNQFWKRWSAEYLHHLQQRSKWQTSEKSFAIGQLVFIQSNCYPPSKWPLARVIETHPGPEGLVRVVTVKLATGTLRRHISRLSPLTLPATNAETTTSQD